MTKVLVSMITIDIKIMIMIVIVIIIIIMIVTIVIMIVITFSAGTRADDCCNSLGKSKAANETTASAKGTVSDEDRANN